MAYRLAFIDEINRLGPRDIILRPRFFTGTPGVGSEGLSMRGGTYDGTYYRPGILSVAPATRNLSPWSWSASHASPAITVDPTTIDPDGLRRGSVWELVAYTRTQSGVLWTGLLDRVRLKKDVRAWRYELAFRDITSMQARAAVDDSDPLTLFDYAGKETTLTNDYTGGSTFRVASTADFYARSDVTAGTEGLFRVDRSGASSYFVQWSAKTSTTLTRIGSNQYGTTIGFAAAGAPVVSLGYFEGHPAVFAQELYTGESFRGVRSVADSGFLRLPDDLFDDTETRSQYGRTPDLEYGFWTDQPLRMDDAARWLGRGGFWLTMRHGRVACRTFPDLGAYWESVVTRRPHPGPGRYLLNFADLATRPAYGSAPIRLESDIYGDGRWQVEYLQAKVSTQDSTAAAPSAALATRRGYPVLAEHVIDLDNTTTEIRRDLSLFWPIVHNGETWVHNYETTTITRGQTTLPNGGPVMYTTTTNNAELAGRLAPWIVHAPQIVTCTVAGSHPEYTIGDSVLFGEDWDLPSAVGGTVAGLYGVIAGVSMDVLGFVNTITIWIPPQREIPLSAGASLVPQP